MFILIAAVIGLPALVFGVLYLRWSGSSWLVDRRASLGRIESFVTDLNVMSEEFPELSSELDLPKVNDAWTVQRAELGAQSGFVSWLKIGCPALTVDHPESELIFSFSRSQAEALSYSIGRVVDSPTEDLIQRLKAVLDQRSGALLVNHRFIRLLPSSVAAASESN